MAHLVKNPPARSQYRMPRRAKPSGVIVLHTAENVMDTVGVDTGAENVAAFIAGRTDAPGSYHIIADSDSRIRLVPFTAEAYGDGTGSNPHVIHISAACRTTDWAQMSDARRAGFVSQMAEGAATAAKWLKKNHGVTVPTERISRAESDRRLPGFIGHGERDPARRSDPGEDFPWDEFLDAFDEKMGRGPGDAALIAAVVDARKAANRAAEALRAARAATRAAEVEARKVGRNAMADRLARRRRWFNGRAKAVVKRRKWLQGRIEAVRRARR